MRLGPALRRKRRYYNIVRALICFDIQLFIVNPGYIDNRRRFKDIYIARVVDAGFLMQQFSVYPFHGYSARR